MLGTINVLIKNIYEIVCDEGWELSLFKYKAYAWIMLTVYSAIILCLYLFASLGISKIAKREKCDKAWLAWIPFAQLIILLETSKSQKICWMEKKTFTVVVFAFTLGSFVLSTVLEIVQYHSTTMKLLFLKNDSWDSIEKYILAKEKWYMDFSNLLSYVSDLFLCFVMYDFFRQKTEKYWIWTIICIFFSGLFPIFIFAFRNVTRYDNVKRYYVNVPPQSNNTRRTDNENLPFEEFNKSSGKDEPFSEFNSVNENTDASNGKNESSDDDILNL